LTEEPNAGQLVVIQVTGLCADPKESEPEGGPLMDSGMDQPDEAFQTPPDSPSQLLANGLADVHPTPSGSATTPQTLFEALASTAAPSLLEEPQLPDHLHGIIPSPQRALISAAVSSRQAQKAVDMLKRWGNSGKTVTFSKGDHVMLRLPSTLLHGIDNTRLPCIVLEEVRPQYYRLLCQERILEGTYRPGDLQPLTGADFATEMLDQLAQYKEGTKGDVSIGTVVRKITGALSVTIGFKADHVVSNRKRLSCRCRGTCNGARCVCLQAGKECTVHCHRGLRQCDRFATLNSSVVNYEEQQGPCGEDELALEADQGSPVIERRGTGMWGKRWTYEIPVIEPQATLDINGGRVLRNRAI